MKKLTIIFLLSVTFPTYSFSEWIEIASTELGSSNYLELIEYTSEKQ